MKSHALQTQLSSTHDILHFQNRQLISSGPAVCPETGQVEMKRFRNKQALECNSFLRWFFSHGCPTRPGVGSSSGAFVGLLKKITRGTQKGRWLDFSQVFASQKNLAPEFSHNSTSEKNAYLVLACSTQAP